MKFVEGDNPEPEEEDLFEPKNDAGDGKDPSEFDDSSACPTEPEWIEWDAGYPD